MPFEKANSNTPNQLWSVPQDRRAELVTPLPGQGDWSRPRNDDGTHVEDTFPELILRRVSPSAFQLVRPFLYRRPNSDESHTIFHNPYANPHDAGNSTNFASVPSLFWWLIASYGHQTLPAIVHDQLYDDKRPALPPADTPGDPSTAIEGPVTVPEANAIFRDALLESKVPFLRRWIMWTGVDAGRRWRESALTRLGVVLEFLAVLLLVGFSYFLLFRWAGLWDWWPIHRWPRTDSQPLWFGTSDSEWFAQGKWTVAWSLIPLAGLGFVLGIRRAGWIFAVIAVALLLIPSLLGLVGRSLLWSLEWLVKFAIKAKRFSVGPRGTNVIEPPSPPIKPTLNIP